MLRGSDKTVLKLEHASPDARMLEKDQVLEALNNVTDPCSLVAGVRAGLVDMGLVSSVDIDGDVHTGFRVHVVLGLTEPSCLMGHAFIPQARAALIALPNVTSVEVKMDYQLPFTWNEGRMTPEYRARLEAHRASSLERLQRRSDRVANPI
jgi:metal-sulfur cluster biosynthetic enzyme